MKGSTITSNSAVGNSSSGGGGITNSGTLTLEGATVEGNTANMGSSSSFSGGGGINNLGSLTASTSTITGNSSSGQGGGINNGDGSGERLTINLTLNDSTVSNNTAVLNGGGINNYGTMSLNRSAIYSNTVTAPNGFGGAIRNEGTLALNNSTVSGNSTAINGGGIETDVGTLSLNNSTVSNNSLFAEGSSGGGIYNTGGGSVVTATNTLLAGNSAAGGVDCFHPVNSGGYNLVGDATGCSYTSATGDQVGGAGSNSIDPHLGPLQANGGPTLTQALLLGSPAIDTGQAGCTDAQGIRLTADQRGQPRPDEPSDGGTCDIGAFESSNTGTPIVRLSSTILSFGNIGLNTASRTFSVTVTNVGESP